MGLDPLVSCYKLNKKKSMPWKAFFRFQRIPLNIHGDFACALCRGLLKMPYYAVARGRTAGIYQTWAECEAQVKGFSGARYKKFDTPQSAQDFINANSGTAPPKSNYYNYKVQYHAGPSSINNLKRNYSTTSNKNGNTGKTKKSLESDNDSTESDQSSDESDDLVDIINKQMDDIEKRVNNFGKGIDKIIKKSTGKDLGKKAMLIEPPAPKKRRSNDNRGDFEVDSDGFVIAYTDGACSQNGRAGARAGLGVYWGEGHTLNTSEPVSGRATNNCGEIQAATCAIRQALENNVKKLAIYTDSQFLINSVTKWMPGWKKKGWKLASGEPVKNEKDFKELDNLQHKLQIKWVYVEAHKGVHGNEMADQLARAGAAMYRN